MTITVEEVKKIAELARIELTPVEEVRYADTISAVLDYMTVLNEVPTDGIEPTFQVTGLSNVLREDIPEESVLRQKLVGQMAEVEMEELVVPLVFED